MMRSACGEQRKKGGQRQLSALMWGLRRRTAAAAGVWVVVLLMPATIVLRPSFAGGAGCGGAATASAKQEPARGRDLELDDGAPVAQLLVHALSNLLCILGRAPGHVQDLVQQVHCSMAEGGVAAGAARGSPVRMGRMRVHDLMPR